MIAVFQKYWNDSGSLCDMGFCLEVLVYQYFYMVSTWRVQSVLTALKYIKFHNWSYGQINVDNSHLRAQSSTFFVVLSQIMFQDYFFMFVEYNIDIKLLKLKTNGELFHVLRWMLDMGVMSADVLVREL